MNSNPTRWKVSLDNSAAKVADEMRAPDDFGIKLGGVVLPSEEANSHFCIVGEANSGKTTLIHLLMQSVLPLIGDKYKRKSYEISRREKENTSEKNILVDDKTSKNTSFFVKLYNFILNIIKQGSQLDQQLESDNLKTTESITTILSDKLILERFDPPLYVGDGHRAFIYDVKSEYKSIINAMDLKCPIVSLNPFNDKSTAWDIALDINTPEAALRFAGILIPEDKNDSKPFFTSASRDLLTNVIIAFIKINPEEWSFHDIILAMKTKENLIDTLNKTPETEYLVSLYFKNEKASDNIMSEIKTRITPFEALANAWDNTKEKISLNHWANNEYILILEIDERYQPAFDYINRAIFQCMSDIVISQSESITRRTWIFLDNVIEAGYLENLAHLMYKGAARGACIVTTFNNIESLYNIYGLKRTDELLSLVKNKVIMKVNTELTQKWVSGLLKEYYTQNRDRYTYGDTAISGNISNHHDNFENNYKYIITDFLNQNREYKIYGIFLTKYFAFIAFSGQDLIYKCLFSLEKISGDYM